MDYALVTLDTLRYDVAADELAAGHTPNLAALIGSWEMRHSPGTFTYAAHAAFFAGFLPTPARPGRHARRFALRFDGAETIGPDTVVLDGASVPEGLALRGYHTLCIGGTGFFNLQNPLGRDLPSRFVESVWERSFGVTDPHSFENQIAAVEARRSDRPTFTFINVSALHQPNHFYLDGGPKEDTLASHAAALRYVDRCIPRLVAALKKPTLLILCSDHGTLYGEDGYVGHRIGHPLVTTVPYAEVQL